MTQFTHDRPQRERVFKSDFLESLTLVKWQTIFKVWIPVVILLIYKGNAQHGLSLSTNIITVLIGVFTWTLAEYLIHRYLFHWDAKSAWGKELVHQMHGNHHNDPMDPLRGVMPIAPAIFYIIILYSIFYIFVPNIYMDIFFAGFLIGYLIYDGIHYYTHHGRPKSKILKYIRRIHLVHHVHDDIIFGISSPFWDIVFGTYKKKN